MQPEILRLDADISIHALREEGDTSRDVQSRDLIISIHALREEGDNLLSTALGTPTGFLSTPSARRATDMGQHDRRDRNDFYPRPPRGGRP